MGKLYILRDYYQPNIASINRCLALAKGFGELGEKIEVVFTFPNSKKETVDQTFINVKFKYLWQKYCPRNKFIKHILCRIYLLNFVINLKKNDIVLLYGTLNPWLLFLLNKKIKIYNELTEIPLIHLKKNEIFHRIYFRLFKEFCHRINGIIVISQSLKEYFINEIGVNENKICIINMFVDPDRFKKIEVEKKNIISYCGTISVKKDGILDLLKSFSLISEKYPNYKLQLIGNYENERTRIEVCDYIDNLGIKENIIITGIVSANIIPKILFESKILVLSRPKNIQAKYGFPTKLGEYLMTENPIIISNVGDINLYFKDKEDIIFTEPDNYIDFAEKLMWAIDNEMIANKIAIKGKNVALKFFNYKIETKKLLYFINN